MKRIALALVALTFSASSVMAADAEDYGNVLNDQVSQHSSYSGSETWNEEHGNVLKDEVARNRGIDSEIQVGDADSGLFDADEDSAF